MKTLRRIGLVLILAGLLVIWGLPGRAMAGGGGADVISDCWCIVTSHGVPGLGSVVTYKSHSTVTPSGNTVLSCHFDIPEGFEPNKAIKTGGFLCGTFLGVTSNSRSVATPGGKITLTCQINGSGGWP